MHHTAEIIAARRAPRRTGAVVGKTIKRECGSLFVLAKSERKQGAFEVVEATMFGAMVIRMSRHRCAGTRSHLGPIARRGKHDG
jgi:hypothetical protein